MVSVLSTIILMFCLNTSEAMAHGEDKFGPHGGYIKMPGAFHIEVVPDKKAKFIKVYLLDMNWKNPTLKNSSLKVTHKKSTSSKELNCQTKTDHYLCLLDKSVSLKNGSLEIEAKREHQVGNIATYTLPLELEKTTDNHHEHHH